MSLVFPPGYHIPDVHQKYLQGEEGEEWVVLVFHESNPMQLAFSLWKHQGRYLIRLRGSRTQQYFDTLPEAIQMGCLKHRLGVVDGPRRDGPDERHR